MKTMTSEQKKDIAERLEAVVRRAYAEQPFIAPDLIEELCNIIRFVADPPPESDNEVES